MSSEPRQHDSDWVGDLFHRHASAVLAYARRRLESREDAEDVVTEVFTTAWRRRADVPDDALPWLYATASHAVAHSARSRVRRANLGSRLASAQPLANPGGGDPSATVTAALDAQQVVAQALGDMSDSDAEILRLWAWEQLAPGEIAEVLGCPPGTARTRLHRARTRLRTALARRGATGFDTAIPGATSHSESVITPNTAMTPNAPQPSDPPEASGDSPTHSLPGSKDPS